MLDWLRDFTAKFGLTGLIALIALGVVVLAIRYSSVLPMSPAHEDALAAADSVATTVQKQAQQMDVHIQQAKEQTKELKEIKDQLRQNHETQAIGSRLTCLRLSKTDAQRDECARIQ